MTAYRTAEVPLALWNKHQSERSQARLANAEGENRARRSADLRERPVCVVCGAALNPERAQSVHIIAGGGAFLHPADEALYTDDGGDMGVWDLGPECARLAPAAYRFPYAR